VPARREKALKNISFVLKDPPLYYDTLYIRKFRKIIMKSRQLLSVVFSLIMFTGVTAGNTAFAESDDDSDNLIKDFEDCVEAGYPIMESYPEQCMTDDGTVFVNNDDDSDDHDDDRYEDDDFDLDDLLDRYCKLNTDDKRDLLADPPRLAPFTDRLANYCEMSEDEQDVIDEQIKEHGDKIRHELRAYSDEYSNKDHGNFRDHFAMYCDMTVEQRAEKMEAKHDALPDDLRADMVRYCEMSEDEQDDFRDIMMDRMDELHDSMKDKMMDKSHMDYKKDMREHLDRYCAMTDKEQKAFVEENDKAEDHVEKMNRYCTLDESDRVNFLEEHKDEYIAHMKAKMHDMKSDHMDYDRLCELEPSELAAEIDDSEKLDRISDWCEMSTEEREDYKKEHHGDLKEKMSCGCHEGDDGNMNCPMMDGESDMQCSMMDEKHEMKEKHHDDDRKHEKKEKFSDQSDRLKAMIMDKRDISDERHDEIRMKFESKHGEDSDEKRSEIKMKYKDHMLKMKFKMSDEHKSDVHQRLAEMKAYKAELRESSEMTDEEKQQLREEFIEKAKSMQLAWISPRTQMTAGIDSAEVECREGYSLVMKASNGVAMCLKADTALKMIDRGIVVPAN